MLTFKPDPSWSGEKLALERRKFEGRKEWLENESDYWGRKPVPPDDQPPDDPDARRKAQLREEMQGRAARRRAARDRRQRGT